MKTNQKTLLTSSLLAITLAITVTSANADMHTSEQQLLKANSYEMMPQKGNCAGVRISKKGHRIDLKFFLGMENNSQR